MHLHNQQRTQSSKRRLPASDVSPGESIRNFLFLIPDTVSELERSAVLAAAHRMTECGYVYLAEAGRKETEDREEIRHLPLNERHLPAFGLTTVVVVLHRLDLAQKALEIYPDAQVFLLSPGESGSLTKLARPTDTDHYLSYLSPWFMTGQMAAMRN